MSLQKRLRCNVFWVDERAGIAVSGWLAIPELFLFLLSPQSGRVSLQLGPPQVVNEPVNFPAVFALKLLDLEVPIVDLFVSEVALAVQLDLLLLPLHLVNFVHQFLSFLLLGFGQFLDFISLGRGQD